MSRADQFFSKFWPVVGPSFTEHVAETEQEVRFLLQLPRLGRRARILDVPCGFGRHAVELARQEMYFGRSISLDEIAAGVDAVTAPAVLRVARELFATDHIALTVLGPRDDLKFTRADLTC